MRIAPELIMAICLLAATGCGTRSNDTNVPDATLVGGAAAPPKGHAHPGHIPDSLTLDTHDTTATLKKQKHLP